MSKYLDRVIAKYSDGPLMALPKLPKAPSVSCGSTGMGPSRNINLKTPYRFVLHNNEGGGTWITRARTLNEARAELEMIYGDRLALVASINRTAQ